MVRPPPPPPYRQMTTDKLLFFHDGFPNALVWSVYFINNISVKNHNTVIRYHNFALFVIVNFTLYRRRSRRRMSEEQEEEEEEEEEEE